MQTIVPESDGGDAQRLGPGISAAAADRQRAAKADPRGAALG